MTKTPQVKPDWNTGIYIGEGVVAEPKLTFMQWYNHMQYRYDVMPTWWWNPALQRQAYENYIETNAIDYGVRHGN